MSSATPRREFLGQIATAAVALAGTACAAPLGAGSASAAPAPAGALRNQQWDLSWVDRITGRHRAVFDSPQLDDGMALNNAYVWRSGYHEVYDAADDDLSAVIVMRHHGVAMAFDDVLWDKYELGKELKVNDPTTGEPARRNPFKHVVASDTHAGIIPGASLDVLLPHGAIYVACALAATAAAGRMAKSKNLDAKVVEAEVRAHLIKGATLAPSGVFGVMRAQEAGCHYIRSS